MTPPSTIVGAVLDSPWLKNAWRRRLGFAAICAVLAVLCFFPEHYEAAAELMPQQSGGGLAAALAQQASGAVLNLESLIGDRTSIEADFTIARSNAVVASVVKKLNLVGKPGYPTLAKAESRIAHKLQVTAVRGAILEVKVDDRDPKFAKALVAATADAIRDQLAAISLQQAADRRGVAMNRLEDAAQRLAQSQAALTAFRVANKVPAPEAQLGAGVKILAGLEAQLQAKKTEVDALRQVATGNNIRVKLAERELANIQQQIAAAKAQSDAQAFNLQGLAANNLKYFDLNRQYLTDEALYQIYSRYLDEVTVNEMSARQNMEIVQPAYISPDRQINIWAAGLLLLALLGAAYIEFYLISTPRRFHPDA